MLSSSNARRPGIRSRRVRSCQPPQSHHHAPRHRQTLPIPASMLTRETRLLRTPLHYLPERARLIVHDGTINPWPLAGLIAQVQQSGGRNASRRRLRALWARKRRTVELWLLLKRALGTMLFRALSALQGHPFEDLLHDKVRPSKLLLTTCLSHSHTLLSSLPKKLAGRPHGLPECSRGTKRHTTRAHPPANCRPQGISTNPFSASRPTNERTSSPTDPRSAYRAWPPLSGAGSSFSTGASARMP